jgi:serralysin
MDHGMTLEQAAGGFLNSPEFAATYGNATDAVFLEKLYGHVLHRAPDQAGLDHWASLLGSGMTRAQVLMNFSESDENQAAIVKVIGNGFEYVPFA